MVYPGLFQILQRGHRVKGVFLFICFLGIIFILAALTGCSPEQASPGQDDSPEERHNGKEETVEIVYVEWASEVASSHVVKTVIQEKLGYDCQLLPVTVTSMWESVAAGDQDGMVAAWLPSLHEGYYEDHKDQVENLGPNLEGAIMGLVVPDYVPVDSIEELNEHAEKFDDKIIGIDPEAGIMAKTNQVMEEYSLQNFDLVTGSDSTMATTLGNAIDKERWIVITGWNPHWKFAKWDLKYLQEPKNVYGDEEYISTIVRKGLEEDMPRVYDFLNNFYWTSEDMEQVMLWIQEEDTTSREAVRRWIEENEVLVDKWVSQ